MWHLDAHPKYQTTSILFPMPGSCDAYPHSKSNPNRSLPNSYASCVLSDDSPHTPEPLPTTSSYNRVQFRFERLWCASLCFSSSAAAADAPRKGSPLIPVGLRATPTRVGTRRISPQCQQKAPSSTSALLTLSHVAIFFLIIRCPVKRGQP